MLTGGENRVEAARFVAAAMECTGEGQRPCGSCDGCRKVSQGIHPDVVENKTSMISNCTFTLAHVAKKLSLMGSF